MKGLMLKDFYMLRRQYLFSYGLMAVMMAGMMLAMGGSVGIWDRSVAVLPMLMIGMMLTFTSSSYDEKCGYMQYAFATPVSRRRYVLAKYLMQIVHTLVGALVGSAVVLILVMCDGHGLHADDIGALLAVAGAGLAGTSLLGGWIIGLVMRFGTIRAQQIFAVTAFVIGGIGAAVGSAGAAGAMDGIPAVWLAVLIGVPAAAILGITVFMFCMSFVWAERREF